MQVTDARYNKKAYRYKTIYIDQIYITRPL